MANAFLDAMFGLEGQVAVVIGGTGVLGGAFCVGLAQAGATVVMSGREEPGIDERLDKLQAVAKESCFLPVDVTKRASIESLLLQTLEKYGRVDMLINAAGVNMGCDYFEVQDEDWERIFRINLTAVHWGCQLFGKAMSEQEGGGSILNIASVTSDKPLSRVFAYSASKAGVANLTQNVARELAPHQVRVNALAPGFFPAIQNRPLLDPERTDSILSQTPMQRFGEPEELIGAVLLLLSRRAGSFITGATYYVDGGFTAMRF
ncbi:D-mannonate oxidoreductase [Planctomycetales bacterium 10988]|nr:D-mannonate oxidoreductase [Planctomycetales bacterium 10988]